MNATKHGLSSTSVVVIRGVEDEAEYEALAADVAADLKPMGAVEGLLAERVAQLFWRLRRVLRFEKRKVFSGGFTPITLNEKVDYLETFNGTVNISRLMTSLDRARLTAFKSLVRAASSRQRQISGGAQFSRLLDLATETERLYPQSITGYDRNSRCTFGHIHLGETSKRNCRIDGSRRFVGITVSVDAIRVAHPQVKEQRMKHRYRLGIIAAIALAGCGSQVAPTGGAPQSSASATHGKSWMLLEAKGEDLLYVTTLAGVKSYSYPRGKHVSTLKMFAYDNSGICSDKKRVTFSSTMANGSLSISMAGRSPFSRLLSPATTHSVAQVTRNRKSGRNVVSL